MTEDVINIRGKIATQPRLSKLEDEVGDLKRVVGDLASKRNRINNAASLMDYFGPLHKEITGCSTSNQCTHRTVLSNASLSYLL